MKKHFLIFALLCCTAFVANAQLFQLGLKAQYATKSLDELRTDLEYTYTNKSTDILRYSNVGLMARLNLGRWVTLQPEANISVSAVWDTVAQQGNFFNQAAWAFQNANTINLTIPVLAAVHLLKFENTLDLRLFAGPEFYTTIKGVQEGEVDFNSYSVVVGVGIDLLNVIYVDGRLTKNSNNDLFYAVGVGLLF
ncbi:MAG: hypothetical protein IJR26_06150 [Bacteroidales bacterium]|nr:hypothetical protein [Bacteroidales bacterium]